ncbi:hypothetical protein [Rhodopirellula sp. MGV]|uniref:hypothetical protein n=1 Tax=Rhodopirellula sp. MGV TaxID=2023130 RepID=UPI000B962477|nr:hypothetical protein [Rhodopirellula sp. MGV]OYP29467.1 hypothetical protein CGZ80_25045 [Rhodopirellula sp. MGV]PNY35822.1 hypothetical protein C2E31_16205 [Rhodopirellula baltica]
MDTSPKPIVIKMDQDDIEFVLGPVPQRAKVEWEATSDASKSIVAVPRSTSGGQVRVDAPHAREATQPMLDHLPVHRDYPALESIQRLYRIAGYVGTMGVFAYLIATGYSALHDAPVGERLARLGEWMQTAVPYLFATVVGAGFLFGAAEGIKLAIDIQENTLAAAHQRGPRRSADSAEQR